MAPYADDASESPDVVEELRRTSRQLERALAEARRAEQMEATFLATMSHEIRTPLNAIIGFAEFLKDPGYTPEEHDSYVQGILNSSGALLSLVNDILDLSKIQAGMMPFRGGSCDLVRVFEEMVRVFHADAAKRGVRLSFQLPDGVPIVALREERIRQILINLIGNAVKFTPAGEVSFSAALVPDGDGTSQLELVVRDTGVGIAPEKFDTIFDPFAQGDDAVRGSRVYQGTGLGLAICRRLLQTVDGTIAVESQVGRGSAFTVRVPRVETQRRHVECVAEGTDAYDLPIDFSVVVVDDVAMNLRILAHHLQRLGVPDARIHAYASAREALAALERDRPRLILTDLWMPDLDGAGLARAVHERPGFADVPLVAQTADSDSARTFDPGLFAAILMKPLTGIVIRRVLAQLFPAADPAAGRLNSTGM